MLTDDKGRATGVAVLRQATAGSQTQTADLVVVSARGDGIGPAAAQFEVEAVPDGPRQPQRLGRPQPAGPRVLRRVGPLRGRGLRRCRRRRDDRDLRFQPRHTRACAAAACSPTSSSACRTCSAATGRDGAPRWGRAHKDVPAAVLQAQHQRDRTGAGDAGLRVPRRAGSRSEGPLGHPGGAHLGHQASARPRDRAGSWRRRPRRG